MKIQACIVKIYTIFVPKKRCLNCKLAIAGNSKGFLLLTEHLIFVSVLRLHLKKRNSQIYKLTNPLLISSILVVEQSPHQLTSWSCVWVTHCQITTQDGNLILAYTLMDFISPFLLQSRLHHLKVGYSSSFIHHEMLNNNSRGRGIFARLRSYFGIQIPINTQFLYFLYTLRILSYFFVYIVTTSIFLKQFFLQYECQCRYIIMFLYQYMLMQFW